MIMTPHRADGLITIARALATDAVCAEVVRAWQSEAIEPILIKGSTIADWLYPGDVRGYGDADLLVAPHQVMAAAAVLERLGFVPVGHHVSLHAHPWVRPSDQAEIDLHVTLWGPHLPPERIWQELQRWVEQRRLGAVPVRVLNGPARVLHVVLHAAQHIDVNKPREDLRRALRVTSGPVWTDAESLADRIGALKAMAKGLELEPAGRVLTQQLPLVRAAVIAEREDAPLAIGFARWSRARSPGAKLAVLIGAFTRPAEDYPSSTSDAGRRTGLNSKRHVVWIARVLHLFSLLASAPRTLRALRRTGHPAYRPDEQA